MLRVILNRLATQAEHILEEEQAGIGFHGLGILPRSSRDSKTWRSNCHQYLTVICQKILTNEQRLDCRRVANDDEDDDDDTRKDKKYQVKLRFLLVCREKFEKEMT